MLVLNENIWAPLVAQVPVLEHEKKHVSEALLEKEKNTKELWNKSHMPQLGQKFSSPFPKKSLEQSSYKAGQSIWALW